MKNFRRALSVQQNELTLARNEELIRLKTDAGMLDQPDDVIARENPELLAALKAVRQRYKPRMIAITDEIDATLGRTRLLSKRERSQ